MQRFGAKLRALRKRRTLTTTELAMALGYTANSYISEIETGKKKPTADFVFKVAKLFNVPSDHLLDDTLDLPDLTAADPSNETAPTGA
jgi:transcriptional regulator with XRE-family HTH domain